MALPLDGDLARDRVRSTVDLPLSPKGKSDVDALGQSVGRRGGFDLIYVSPLSRGRATAKPLIRYGGGRIVTLAALQPWMMGTFEGQHTQNVHDQIHEYSTRLASMPVPGVGAWSGDPGESSQAFERRFLLGAVVPILDQWKADRTLKIAFVSHSKNIKLLTVWIDAGAPADLQFDRTRIDQVADTPPSSLSRVFLKAGKWVITHEPVDGAGPFPGSVYPLRHGATPWNAESYPAPKNSQEAA